MITLRPFRKDDFALLHAACEGVFEGNDYMPSLVPSILNDERFEVLVIELHHEEGEKVGVTALQLMDGGRTAFIFGLRVLQSFQGRGLGSSALKAQMLRALGRNGVERCRYTLNSAIETNFRLAAKVGMTVGQRWPLLRRQGEPEIEALKHALAAHAEKQPELKSISVAELQKVVEDGEMVVVLPAWKATAVAHLHEHEVEEVVVESEGGGVSVSGWGSNSSQGRVLALWLSPTAHLAAHVLHHLRQHAPRDVEVFCQLSHLAQHAPLLEANLSPYQQASAVLVECSQLKDSS